MKHKTNFKELLQRDEIENLKDILMERGYRPQYASDKDSPEVLDFKLIKGKVIVLIKFNEDKEISIVTLTTRKREEVMPEKELKELNEVCETIEECVNGMPYELNEKKNMFSINLQLERKIIENLQEESHREYVERHYMECPSCGSQVTDISINKAGAIEYLDSFHCDNCGWNQNDESDDIPLPSCGELDEMISRWKSRHIQN